MSVDAIVWTLWRRRGLFLASLALFTGLLVAVTLALPKTYRATATLYVGSGQRVDDQSADTATGEQLVRTYTTLAGNPNVADEVLRTLPEAGSRAELLARMSFAPVERTRLIEVSAEEGSPERASQVANAYAGVFVNRVNAEAARESTGAKVALSEPAALPTTAVKPNPPLYIGLGSVLAALLAAGVALVRDRLDDRVAVGEDDEDFLGFPIVGRIPSAKTSPGDLTDARLADAIRMLKANLDFLGNGASGVVLVTSAGAVEGKSSVAVRLALSSLGDGEKVALVEADMRRPGVAAGLGELALEPGAQGLSNYLAGVAKSDDVLHPVPSRPGLSVVPAGPAPPNPSGLLRSRPFGALIGQLARRCDRVVIDTPPVSVGADASVAMPEADVVLFVVDAEGSRSTAVRAGLNQLRAAKAGPVGIVVSRAQGAGLQASGYYHNGRPPVVEALPDGSGPDRP